MSAPIFRDNPDYAESVRLLIRLHKLFCEGKGESVQADEIREATEPLWWKLAEIERERIDNMAADLSTLEPDSAFTHPEVVEVDASEFWKQVGPLRREGRFTQVLGSLRKMPECVAAQRATVLRALSYEQLGEHEIALVFFEAAARFEKEGDAATTLFLSKLFNYQRRKEAVRLASALAENPEPLSIELSLFAADILGILTSRQEDKASVPNLRQAQSLFSSAIEKIEKWPENPQAKFWLNHSYKGIALCHYQLDNQAETIRFLDRAIATDSTDHEALTLRGLMCDSAQVDDAIAYFRRATEMRSPDVWPYLFLAFDALVNGRYSECLNWCALALTRSRDREILAELHEWIAISLAETGTHHDRVREMFQRALLLSPANERVVHNFDAFENALAGKKAVTPRWDVQKDIETHEALAFMSGRVQTSYVDASTSGGGPTSATVVAVN